MARVTASKGGGAIVRVDPSGVVKLRRELNRLGDKELKKALYKGLNTATKPMRANAQREAEARLPKRGGLNRRVAAQKLGTKTSRDGVSILGSRRMQLRAMDAGSVRHPVFGNRKAWVNEPVRGGWFTEPMQEGGPVARKEITSLIDGIAREAAKRSST